MSFHIRVEVSCPKCIQSTVVDGKKIPEGKLKVVCRRCCHQFPMDRTTGLNCKIRTLGTPDQPVKPSLEDMEWLVDANLCKGFRYDIKGLGILVRGGVIDRYTRIKASGTKGSIPAGRLVQLKPFFDERDKQRSYQRPQPETNTDMTLEGHEQPDHSKAWYEMDCSDFFEDKLKPFLARDQKKPNKAVG